MLKNFVLGVVAVTAIAVANTQVSASEDDRLFKWYGDAPKGSKMRPIEATSYIPFNKKYDQLTERQKNIYRSYFEGLQKDETPPFPLGGLEEIYEPLIKGHARVGGGGELLVFSKIDKKGVVQEVTVYKSPTKKLAELVTTVMFNTKFKPAMCAGEPCGMDFPFLYDVPNRHRALRSLDKEDFGKGDISTKVSG